MHLCNLIAWKPYLDTSNRRIHEYSDSLIKSCCWIQVNKLPVDPIYGSADYILQRLYRLETLPQAMQRTEHMGQGPVLLHWIYFKGRPQAKQKAAEAARTKTCMP